MSGHAEATSHAGTKARARPRDEDVAADDDGLLSAAEFTRLLAGLCPSQRFDSHCWRLGQPLLASRATAAGVSGNRCWRLGQPLLASRQI
jgi:hypothetical protein